MSRETFLSINDDGQLEMVTENDGWSMRRGPERDSHIVTLEQLKGGQDYEEGKRLLKYHKNKAAR